MVYPQPIVVPFLEGLPFQNRLLLVLRPGVLISSFALSGRKFAPLIVVFLRHRKSTKNKSVELSYLGAVYKKV
jgi:hypothetical protein